MVLSFRSRFIGEESASGSATESSRRANSHLNLKLQHHPVPTLLSFRSRFIGEESASGSTTADSSRDTPALRNDKREKCGEKTSVLTGRTSLCNQLRFRYPRFTD